MKQINYKLTLTEPILGSQPANPKIHSEFVASKASKDKREEEIESIPEDGKGVTVFARDEDGDPILWDYQIKGFFKDAAKMLRKIKGTESSKIKAYKQEIDGLIFPTPRKIKIIMPEGSEIGTCERPLRASTPMGERVALSSSEMIPAGSYLDFDVKFYDDSMEKWIDELFEYGKDRGLGQWRNSGMGRFTWEKLGELQQLG